MTKPLIHLVDDNDAFRRSTAWVLESAGFEVRDYPGGREFLDAWANAPQESRPVCLLSDIRMPDMNGMQLQQELRRLRIELPLVFITGHGDVPLAVEAMRNGAVNFVEKPCSPEHLVDVLRQGLAAPAAGASSDGEDAGKLAQLTPRERQVFDLVVEGKLNKIIADVLSISIKTVEMHRANMMAKLGARNLPDLVRLSIAAGDEGRS